MFAELTGGKKVEKLLKKLSKKGGVLSVGFFKKARYAAEPAKPAASGKVQKNGKPVMRPAKKENYVAQVAFWNEYGTDNAPARPFFRTAIKKNQSRWAKGLKKQLLSSSFDVGKSLSLLGAVMQGDIRQSILEWSDPVNAQITIDMKGFNDPLVDTHDMEKSVSWEYKE